MNSGVCPILAHSTLAINANTGASPSVTRSIFLILNKAQIVTLTALHSVLSDAPAYGCTKLTIVGIGTLRHLDEALMWEFPLAAASPLDTLFAKC